MTHNFVYFIGAESYSDLGELRRAGIIDFHQVQHSGTPPTAQVVADCNAAGLSPILNNGNDGKPGWNGSDSYYITAAAQGWHAAGGESEQAGEIDSIMNHLIFLNYGGEGTPGGNQDDIFAVTHPGPVHGYGCASYFETYDQYKNFWGWNIIGEAVRNAKVHGVKEIGICVGSWMKGQSTSQDYISLANAFETNGVTCSGIGVWGGYGSNANAILNTFTDWFQTWMAIWPPQTLTMKKRF